MYTYKMEMVFWEQIYRVILKTDQHFIKFQIFYVFEFSG